MTLGSLLNDAGLIVTESLDWVNQVVEVITDNPLLLLFAVLPLVGLGIGLVRRLLNVQ